MKIETTIVNIIAKTINKDTNTIAMWLMVTPPLFVYKIYNNNKINDY